MIGFTVIISKGAVYFVNYVSQARLQTYRRRASGTIFWRKLRSVKTQTNE